MHFWIWSNRYKKVTFDIMSNGGWKHQSVLLAESIEFLNPVASGRYIDATLGAGGHSEALLSQEGSVEILGIDRD